MELFVIFQMRNEALNNASVSARGSRNRKRTQAMKSTGCFAAVRSYSFAFNGRKNKRDINREQCV